MIREPVVAEPRSAMKTLELYRHARRDPNADELSPEGRAQAEDLGRSLSGRFDAVYVSPAQRAAQTVAWILRGMHVQLPAHHVVVPGLAGKNTDGSPLQLGEVLAELLADVPEGGRALAVSHTPIVEKAVAGLTGREIEPLGECEGVVITLDDDAIQVEERRRRPG
jgi:phosphohistidine phosphatase SixA